MKREIDEEYLGRITDLISILHDLKHEGKLPKVLDEWEGFIEEYSPDKFYKK